MRSIVLLALAGLCSLYTATSQAQTLQKLSLGVLAGRNSPTGILVEGELADNFVANRTYAGAKGLMLQYDFSDNLYSRLSFKKAEYNLENDHKTYRGGNLVGLSTFGIAYYNKQYELNVGYRGRIKGRLSFTGSVGATYLDFKRGNVGTQPAGITARDSSYGYSMSIGSNLLKERIFLASTALGLEYKTRRNNVLSIEGAYYHGFATAASFNFATDTHPTETAPSQHAEASAKTKGSYAELRLGYRIPLQNFANLYTAIRRPKSKPEPEPEYLTDYRFKGGYWGLETGKQTAYSQQVQQWPDRTDKTQPSFWTPYFAFNAGYQFKTGFIAEGGLRLGAGGIQQSAEDIFGMGSGAQFLLLTIPVSVKYAAPLIRNKLYLTPETGVWMSYSSWTTESEFTSGPNRSGSYTNIITTTHVLGQKSFSGYHAGLSLNARFGKSTELGFGYRYADSFSKKAIAEIETTYDYHNVPQPSILTTTRLKNDAFTISFRKFLRK